MQPEIRRKYRIYFALILAGMFGSLALLRGPLEKAERDLAAPTLKRTAREKPSRDQVARDIHDPTAELKRIVGEKAARDRIGGFGRVYFLAFLGMTLYGAHVAARFLADKSMRKREGAPREVRWSIPESVVLTFLFLTLPFVFALLVPGSPSNRPAEDEFTVGDVVANFVSSVVVLLLAIKTVNQRGGSFREEMGLRIHPRGRLVLIGAAAFLAFWPFRLIYTTVLLAFFQSFRLPVESHPVVQELTKAGGTDLKLSLVFSVAVCAPLFEEIFFRGFLYQGLRKRMGALVAIFGTAAFFAVAHFSPFQTGLVFPLGLLLAYLMEKTGSIIPGVVLHFLTNGTTLAALFLVGG